MAFWDHVNKTETCWLWTGALDAEGYSRCGRGVGGIYSQFAHRRVYQMLVGEVPEGLVLDHLCRVRNCVNPAHVEPVTQGENVRRGLGARPRTHCPRGHEYNEENTYVYRDSERKYCRVCNREKKRQGRVIEFDVGE